MCRTRPNDVDKVLAGYAKLIADGASCKHIVQIARDEVEANPRATDAMREFSNIRESDAEVGARRVLCKYGLTTPVAATKAINITLTFLYRNGLWIREG
ncbi:unnamed protein product [Cladocopium goreaui]|uniref:Uncharacterized protein n=1 Tax=Cladocopium goreaui TaxID=2562237 RepID=A0A9P1GLP3_9DINO|nr:unnamed protein product [Cladocopium goreaui]